MKICCGSSHSLALTKDGIVYGWGKNEFGQTGNESFKNQLFPNKIEGIDGKVTQISCGLNHSMALTESLKVYCWGRNDCGQLGYEQIQSLNVATPLTTKLEFIQIACGERHNLLLSKNKRVYSFGSNEYKQLGYQTHCSKQSHEPSKIDCELDFSEIASHYSCQFSVALRDEKEVYAWGKCRDRSNDQKFRNIKRPTLSGFEKISDVFIDYMGISNEPYKIYLNSKDYFFQNGRYEKEFEDEKIIYGGLSIKPEFNCEVCKAKNKWNNGEYIIKKIVFQHENRHRVFRETQMMAKSNEISAHVVQYYSSWFEFVNLKHSNESLDRPILYIQMELCKRNLDEVIQDMKNDVYLRSSQKNQNLTKSGYFIACELFREILEGVQYLHGLNIIHTDLKEENIFITNGHDKRFVKIGDFGESKFHEHKGQFHTGGSGTVSHRAPEITDNINEDNKADYNTKADIYSLAVLIKRLFSINVNFR